MRTSNLDNDKMSRYDFRVKVDLSHFYNDVRRSSWVYVDKGEISCICHLQKHIEKLFTVQGAFHLLLDTGEYLPPNEDARVLKENETILVVPGTGLQSQPILKKVSSDERVAFDTDQKERVSPESGKNKSDEDENENRGAMETTGENTLFLSMISNSTLESASKLKTETSTLEESSMLEDSPLKSKRKRIRRRKTKTENQSDQPSGNEAVESEHKKPKIINSVTISNGKHIRFGDIEKQEFQGYESSVSTDSKKVSSNSGKIFNKEESCWDKPATDFNLSNLLALRQSSTPITFYRKKQDSQELEQNVGIPEAKEKISTKECQSIEKNRQPLLEDFKKYPLMANKTRLNDVIAFKMLKMGSDYTPQVSGNISARVIQVLPDGSSYLLKIIHGKEEVQEPQGKFDLETEETENNDNDVITLSWSQLLEPRLIYRE